MKILVTGGAGFIGSHTCVELLNNKYEIVVIDDFSNSNIEAIENISKITGKNFPFYEGNVCDKNLLKQIFSENKIDAVIHFAAFKAVGESVEKPLKYYRNNIDSTLSLLEVMIEFGVKKIVFSSSATVYGNPNSLPIKENFPLSTTNPYGSTKLIIEGILKDLYKADSTWGIAILRYFNPIGAHESGLIGENPNDIPNNLMPYIVKVANKELEYLSVYGNDYNTHDGTGVRDYIHVVDLAIGHLKAIEKIQNNSIIDCYNLGTGIGYSVLDLVETYKRVNNVEVPYKIVDRRPGDIDVCYADPSYALQELNFKASRGIEEMCKDAFNYVKRQKN